MSDRSLPFSIETLASRFILHNACILDIKKYLNVQHVYHFSTGLERYLVENSTFTRRVRDVKAFTRLYR